MKVICFDVDGVLAAFDSGFNDRAYELTGVRLAYPWPTWDSYGGLDPGQVDQVWRSIKEDPSFWRTLPPLVDRKVFKRIERLHAEHSVYFVTHRMGVFPKDQTEEWLSSLGIWRPTVIVSKLKGEAARAVGATHFLEDKAENAWAVAWLSPGTRSFLLDKPYNQYDAAKIGSSKVRRVFSVEEFLEEVEDA